MGGCFTVADVPRWGRARFHGAHWLRRSASGEPEGYLARLKLRPARQRAVSARCPADARGPAGRFHSSCEAISEPGAPSVHTRLRPAS